MRASGGLVAALVICAVVSACGTSERDEKYLAVVAEALGPNPLYELEERELIDAAHRSCDVMVPDDDESMEAAGAEVARVLDIDEFTAGVLALAGAVVYCKDRIPPKVLGP